MSINDDHPSGLAEERIEWNFCQPREEEREEEKFRSPMRVKVVGLDKVFKVDISAVSSITQLSSQRE